MTALARRAAAGAGLLVLTGVLTLVATVLLVGGPRLANRDTDAGLADRVAALPYQARDLNFSLNLTGVNPIVRPVQVDFVTTSLATAMGPALRSRLAQRWSAIQAGPVPATGDGLPVNGSAKAELGLRYQSNIASAASIVEGDWPGPALDATEALKAAVSVDVAAAMNLKLGSSFLVGPDVAVSIVGIFAVHDAADLIWEPAPLLVRPRIPVGEDNAPTVGIVAVHPTAFTAVSFRPGGTPAIYTWRYRVDETRLDSSVGQIDQMVAEIAAARRQQVVPPVTLDTGLDSALLRFGREVAAVRALLAVVSAGLLATLFGLLLLAASAEVARRRNELALLRARGAATWVIASWLLAESALVVPLALAAGWLVSLRLPGRPGETDAVAVAFAVAALVAPAVLGAVGQRRVSFAGVRPDAVAPGRRSPRVVAGLALMVAAALGVLLLRQRGLNQSSGVDAYLASVPILLAGAAAVVALAVLPWPLRLFGALAARSRGAVAFLGLARSGRAAAPVGAPLAVLVVAVCTGVFSTGVAAALAAGRDGATDQAVPADAVVAGFYFAAGTDADLAALPGVSAVAPISVNNGAALSAGSTSLRPVLGVAVDGRALAQVAAGHHTVSVPAALTGPAISPGTAGGVPAVVSPSVAAELGGLGGRGAVLLQGQPYEFDVAAVADAFPGVAAGDGRFVVLAWQALDSPEAKPVLATGFLIAGSTLDVAALAATGDDGQRRWRSAVTGRPVERVEPPTRVTTWTQARSQLERTGVNQVLQFTFRVGGTAGTVLALVAVAFAVAAGARSRGHAMSRLRTMGLTQWQGRRMLAYELAPLLLAGALAGAVVGTALPAMIGPALSLSSFTDGYPAPARPDLFLAGVTLGLVGAALAVALGVELAINRRLRLAEALRFGEGT